MRNKALIFVLVLLVIGLIFILYGALKRTQNDKNSILILQKMTKKYELQIDSLYVVNNKIDSINKEYIQKNDELSKQLKNNKVVHENTIKEINDSNIVYSFRIINGSISSYKGIK